MHKPMSDDTVRVWRLAPRSRWRSAWRAPLFVARCLLGAASALSLAVLLVLAGVWISAPEEEGLLRVFDLFHEWVGTLPAARTAPPV